MMGKGQLVIEYEQGRPPKMVFVSKDGIDFELYIDGKLVKGIREVGIHAGLDEYVLHEVAYQTGLSEQ